LTEQVGVHPLGVGIYPKAQVLNRFIAKLIDLFLAAAAAEVIAPVGFLAGLAYLLVADGFAGGRSVGKRLIGLQTILPGTRESAGFRESIIRNIPFAAAQLAFAIPYVGPYVGWLASAVIVGFEAILIIGNEQGRRLGDELAGTQVLDAGRLAMRD
jgi:RDD family protein